MAPATPSRHLCRIAPADRKADDGALSVACEGDAPFDELADVVFAKHYKGGGKCSWKTNHDRPVE